MTGASIAQKPVVPVGWLRAGVKPFVACGAQSLVGTAGRP